VVRFIEEATVHLTCYAIMDQERQGRWCTVRGSNSLRWIQNQPRPSGICDGGTPEGIRSIASKSAQPSWNWAADHHLPPLRWRSLERHSRGFET